jgi:hypothetical protein
VPLWLQQVLTCILPGHGQGLDAAAGGASRLALSLYVSPSLSLSLPPPAFSMPPGRAAMARAGSNMLLPALIKPAGLGTLAVPRLAALRGRVPVGTRSPTRGWAASAGPALPTPAVRTVPRGWRGPVRGACAAVPAASVGCGGRGPLAIVPRRRAGSRGIAATACDGQST